MTASDIVIRDINGPAEMRFVEELQKGYLLGDDLLRPAKVKVATRQ